MPHSPLQPTANGAPLNYDLDNKDNFDTCWTKLRNAKTSNFSVGFGATVARCAVDLDATRVKEWLDGRDQSTHETVWLNIWADETQKPIIDLIADKYDLSPRLSSLMCPQKSKSRNKAALLLQNNKSNQPGLPPQTASDVEKAVKSQIPPAVDALQAMKQLSFGDVVDDIWHFESVDWGKRYLYVGFNSLFSIPGATVPVAPDKPSGQRIWTSLLLCDDGTIISVFERPPLDSPTYAAATQVARRNVLNVFRHLSVFHMNDKSSDALMKVRIRPERNAITPGIKPNVAEPASLLFYYLFDDWITTYALIAGVEHPYRDQLESLRQNMTSTADVTLVASLHSIGRQLTVLKLIYSSYEQIVSRILFRQRVLKEASQQTTARAYRLHHSQHPSASRSSSPDHHQPAAYDSHHYITDEDEIMSVRLSTSSIVRFERLFDRIRLYALTEIDECLREKEALVLMNFNLVALKESQAVEKLTRTTIVLAKATILFLPVSLMTGYFSIQIGNLGNLYSLRTYWFSFLVVAVLSLLFLVGFSYTTDRVEGRTEYKSMFQILKARRKVKSA